MTLILFIIILLVLIFVHELGHFLAAKSAKIKVHEFALGFSPKIWKKKKGETEYSLGIVPFGGYVRIHGENPEDVTENDPDKDRALNNKPWYIQAWVLVAGVLFNVLFAWLLISITYMVGSLNMLSEESHLELTSSQVIVMDVQSASPAEEASIKRADRIISIEDGHYLEEIDSIDDVRTFIGKSSADSTLHIKIMRDGQELLLPIQPKEGIVEGQRGIGISMNILGVVKYGFFESFIKAAQTVYYDTVSITKGMGNLLARAFTGNASLSEVTGPVGIAGMVGDARAFGVSALLSFTALISLNLAVINMMPLPALDGGRLFIVLIEALTRKKVPMKLQGWVNGIGFLLLIGLMILVTIGDVGKLLK